MDFKEQEKAFLKSLSASIDDDSLTLSIFKGMIAAEISCRRIKIGLSQKEFAEKMGVSQSLVSRWENGETNFTLSTLVKIASVLKIEMQSPYVPSPAKMFTSKNNNIIAFSSVCPNTYKCYSESISDTYSMETDDELKEM